MDKNISNIAILSLLFLQSNQFHASDFERSNPTVSIDRIAQIIQVYSDADQAESSACCGCFIK